MLANNIITKVECGEVNGVPGMCIITKHYFCQRHNSVPGEWHYACAYSAKVHKRNIQVQHQVNLHSKQVSKVACKSIIWTAGILFCTQSNNDTMRLQYQLPCRIFLKFYCVMVWFCVISLPFVTKPRDKAIMPCQGKATAKCWQLYIRLCFICSRWFWNLYRPIAQQAIQWHNGMSF